LRVTKNNLDPDGDIDYYTFDFRPLTDKDPRTGQLFHFCISAVFDHIFAILLAPMLLKFGRKGRSYETFVRLSDDKKFVEWDGKWFSWKKKAERRGQHLLQRLKLFNS